MATLDFNEEKFQAPIAGESFTVEPGKHPYDRPPQFTNPSEAMQKLMQSLSQPKNMNRVLDLMSDGVPVDHISNVILQSMFGEGAIPPQLIVTLTPALLMFLTRTAEKAGVKVAFSDEGEPDPSVDISTSDIESTVEFEAPQEEVPEEPQGGLMARPEVV